MYKVTIKKNLIIFHYPGDWVEIYSKILQDFGMGMAVRPRLRRELGFVYRNYQGLVPNEYSLNKRYQDQIHLDFYSEAAQSWFQLKYLNV